MKAVDLRSDTITRPSAAMLRAMMASEVGDDVFGEDPTVNALQERVAGMLGKEAALFVPSGTMGNQVCIKTHTEPGDEVIVEREAHVFIYETAAPSLLSGVQLHPVPGVRGVPPLDEIRRAIRPHSYYMPPTRLLCLENTHGRSAGSVIPLAEIARIRELALREKIAMHLDGARLWNACAASGEKPERYASYFDSVSVCFSKGLGAPVGSMIAGSSAFIDRARRFRKIFGGGMRQAGILAGAAIYALDHNLGRLSEDHEKARLLAGELARLKSFAIDMNEVQTNMVIADVSPSGKTQEEVLTLLKSEGVLLTPERATSIRAVTHLDVSMEDVKRAAGVFRKLFRLKRLPKEPFHSNAKPAGGGAGKYKFRSTIDVRNYEVDWQGIVHNANYLLYFETGRIAYLRHLGLPVDMKSIRTSSRVVLARNEINYRSPALFGERLEVLTRVSEIGHTSFTFEGEIRRHKQGKSELVSENIAVHVWLDGKRGNPVPVAEKFRQAVVKFEGERVCLRAPEGKSREQNRRARGS